MVRTLPIANSCIPASTKQEASNQQKTWQGRWKNSSSLWKGGATGGVVEGARKQLWHVLLFRFRQLYLSQRVNALLQFAQTVKTFVPQVEKERKGTEMVTSQLAVYLTGRCPEWCYESNCSLAISKCGLYYCWHIVFRCEQVSDVSLFKVI